MQDLQDLQETQEIKRIESYSLLEFAEKLQEAFLEGYRLDVGSNENAPISFGSFQTCGMVRKGTAAVEAAVEVVEEAAPAVEEAVEVAVDSTAAVVEEVIEEVKE